METLTYIAPWVLGSVCVGVAAGFFLGRGRDRGRESEIAERERQAALRMLVELLNSAEHLHSNVESHNSEIRENARHVKDLRVSTEMQTVKRALLGHMAALLESNKLLQQDLTCTRYRLEEQAEEIDHARREARTDELTGVANRKALNEKVHVLLDGRKRHAEPFVLLLADLDQFKRINDAHGHPVGDRVLKTIGGWLRQWVREGDFVGRYGGDEFVILLPKTELAVGAELAETIRVKAAEKVSAVVARREQIAVSLSIGVVSARPDDDAESLLHRADRALYRCKNLGRNQVQCEEPQQAPEQNAPSAPPLEAEALVEHLIRA